MKTQYPSIDSIIAPLQPTMENPDTYTNLSLDNKLDGFEVTMAGLGTEPLTPEFDSLSLPREHTHHHNGIARISEEYETPAALHRRPGFPRASSPTGSVRSSFSSRRRISRGVSFQGSKFARGRRFEVSKELSSQTEVEFRALIELMTGISKRSISLKEIWTKIISERESCILEMDRMSEQFEEYSETIERYEKDKHSHNDEHEHRKKEVVQINLKLTAAIASASEYKRKLSERDTELATCRGSLIELKDNYKYLKEEHEETKTSLDETQLKLVACEESRRNAEVDAKKYNSELRTLKQEYESLRTSHSELTSLFESTSKELVTSKSIITTLKKEKYEWIHEKEELHEELRKCKHSYEEEHKRWEEAEARCGKWKSKWEHYERELSSVREELQVIEVERKELHERITKVTEELRKTRIEKKRIEEELHDACLKGEASHREVLLIQEKYRRTETMLKEKTELVHTLQEHIERIEIEREDFRRKCGDLSSKVVELETIMIALKLDVELITKDRDDTHEKLRHCESKYEEIFESFTEIQESGGSSEYELSSLRALLKEVREQKENAITMRNTADRERDEFIMKYDEKCREYERLEESYSHHSNSFRGKIGGRTISHQLIRENSSFSAGGE